MLSKGTNPKNQPPTDAGRVQLAETLASISNQLSSDDSGPFGDQDVVLNWIADLLIGLGEDTAPATVLTVVNQFTGVPLRIRAWKRVENKLKHAYRTDWPAWYSTITTHLVRESTADFVDHLKRGDHAAVSAGVGYQVHFVLRHDPAGLRARVLELLVSKEADLSVLASRLVSARTIAGIKPDWQLSSDFDQDTFNQLAPPGDDPWYEKPIQEVDRRDLTWANRRRFAAGRVSPPPAPVAVSNSDPSADLNPE